MHCVFRWSQTDLTGKIHAQRNQAGSILLSARDVPQGQLEWLRLGQTHFQLANALPQP